ncbi:MAG: DUF1566 domain-containing protein [Desulfobacterales bacterium]|jgi:hypothetical protein
MKFSPRIISAQKIMLAIGLFVLLGFIVIPAIASDRFVAYGDGTVTDTKTGLMWAAKDNGGPINWKDAYTYCQNYSGGGHTNWRMPTLAELSSLYDPKKKNKHGYHVNKQIGISVQSCWASETRGSKAARFNFTYGQVYWLRQFYSGPSRVIPVRSGN